ncbi:histidine kinase [Paenibacillus pasadenensis]|uniref:sensor histidine kinase n=1 Tax=Paenibacillus pasadenensis TaxID=217090 RepID=UPI00203D5A63|nr:histidine kinase [Paenibacillus pasadenensis]MCM3749717.1 histidine kinase [Paenibacillus pasadenensis]
MQVSIQTRLLLSFTLLSSVLVASSSYLYYKQTSKDLMIQIEETNRQQLFRYQETLDNMIEDMDRISAQVIYSSEIKNYLLEQANEDSSSFQSFAERKKYESMLALFNGPWFIAAQINLINMDGFFLTYGQNMNTVTDEKQRIQQAHWLKEAFKLEGDKLLVPPHPSEWQENHPIYFSLTRSFNFPAAFPPTAVEVQQSYELLAQSIEIGRNATSRASVYIINDEGEVFYPYSQEKAAPPTIPRWTEGVLEIKRADGSDTDIWSQVRSEFSGLTILIQQPKSEIMQPIVQLRQITFILAIVGEIASFLIAYVLSAGIASPIRYLQRQFEKITIDSISISKVKKLQKTKEIASLYATFEEMRARLNHSLNEVIQFQQRESLAHLQAMYAQMNPHFLFNTLNAMASYADESGFPEYARISQQLSGMLRYSTNSMTRVITLKQESQYTIQYLELMRFRYEDQFKFSVEIDPHLEDEPVPKFLLQPLVENSFAHGFQSVRPPWHIEVSAKQVEASLSWEIRLQDNGSGFTADAFAETQSLIQELNNGQLRDLLTLSNQELGHLGIVNTLTRCRLFWNEDVRFYLRQREPGMEFVIQIRKEQRYVPSDSR